MVKQIGTFTAEITDACMEGREVEGRNQEKGVGKEINVDMGILSWGGRKSSNEDLGRFSLEWPVVSSHFLF